MMLSLGMSQSVRQILTQRQAVIAVQTHILSLRLELIHVLRGEKYNPSGKCPKCNRQLTPLEIIRGFNNDPTDYTTACTACGTRFNPKLMNWSPLGNMELPFFCSAQTLYQLRGNEGLNPDELKKLNPAVYHSAIVHHGTIRNAFSEIGVQYGFDEVMDWKNKICSFLGRLPDTVIAQAVGVSAKAVARQRKIHKIPRCTKESMLEEACEDS